MFFCTFAIALTIGFKGKLVIKMKAPKTTDIINNGVFKAHFVSRDVNVVLDSSRSVIITIVNKGIINQFPYELKNDAFLLIKIAIYSIALSF